MTKHWVRATRAEASFPTAATTCAQLMDRVVGKGQTLGEAMFWGDWPISPLRDMPAPRMLMGAWCWRSTSAWLHVHAIVQAVIQCVAWTRQYENHFHFHSLLSTGSIEL